MQVSTQKNVAGRLINVYTPEFLAHRQAKFTELKAAITPKLKRSSNNRKTPSDRLQKLTNLLGA